MQMLIVTLAMLVCFQVKHLLADYVLQPGWMLAGKGDLRRAGGYAHAGIHAVGSIPAYLVAGIGASEMLVLLVAEFVVHYAIDFSKARLSRRVRSGPDTRLYWAMHGADQFLHQMTYIALVAVVQLS
jgi:hypothetical protein